MKVVLNLLFLMSNKTTFDTSLLIPTPTLNNDITGVATEKHKVGHVGAVNYIAGHLLYFPLVVWRL